MSVERFEVGKLYRLAIGSDNLGTTFYRTGDIYMILAVDTRTYQRGSAWAAQVVLPTGDVLWSYLTLRNWELVETS
jgi:hypothetical protein